MHEPMHEPSKQAEQPNLKLVSSEPALAATAATAAEQTSFAGGGGGGGGGTQITVYRPLMKDIKALWTICAIGSIMVVISLLALWKDPAAATYKHNFFFTDCRVSCELLLLLVGSACFVTAISCLRALAQARKLEKGSHGRVKSLPAKRLEKMSDDSFFGIIGSYIAALLGCI